MQSRRAIWLNNLFSTPEGGCLQQLKQIVVHISRILPQQFIEQTFKWTLGYIRDLIPTTLCSMKQLLKKLPCDMIESTICKRMGSSVSTSKIKSRGKMWKTDINWNIGLKWSYISISSLALPHWWVFKLFDVIYAYLCIYLTDYLVPATSFSDYRWKILRISICQPEELKCKLKPVLLTLLFSIFVGGRFLLDVYIGFAAS